MTHQATHNPSATTNPKETKMNFPTALVVCTPPAETAGGCVEVTIESALAGDFAATVGGQTFNASSPEGALCLALCEGGFRGWKPVSVGATFEGGGHIIGGARWVTVIAADGTTVPLTAEDREKFRTSYFIEGFAYAAEILGRGSSCS